MKSDCDIGSILKILRKENEKWKAPIVTLVASHGGTPFDILISTILSLRTKDETTAKATQKLLAEANNPYDMLKLSVKKIEKLIYPVGFYRTKAKNIKKICKILIEKYNGKVPDTIEELVKLPGVGRKTANLVIIKGYGKYGICVDTHVHRISNRWGYVSTKTPEETEMELRKKLPKQYWEEYNDLLVAFGQTLCKPIGPKCDVCPLLQFDCLNCVKEYKNKKGGK